MSNKIKRGLVLAREIVDTFQLKDGITRILKSVIDTRHLNIRYRTGESNETVDFILLDLSGYMVTRIRPNSTAVRKIINIDSNSERPVLEITMEQIRKHIRKHIIDYVVSVTSDIVIQENMIDRYSKNLNIKIITAGILEKIVNNNRTRYQSYIPETLGSYSGNAKVAQQYYTYSKKINDPRMKLVRTRRIDTDTGVKERYDYIW